MRILLPPMTESAAKDFKVGDRVRLCTSYYFHAGITVGAKGSVVRVDINDVFIRWDSGNAYWMPHRDVELVSALDLIVEALLDNHQITST